MSREYSYIVYMQALWMPFKNILFNFQSCILLYNFCSYLVIFNPRMIEYLAGWIDR